MTFGMSVPAQLALARKDVIRLNRLVANLEHQAGVWKYRYEKQRIRTAQTRAEFARRLQNVEDVLLSQSPLQAVTLVRELQDEYRP